MDQAAAFLNILPSLIHNKFAKVNIFMPYFAGLFGKYYLDGHLPLKDGNISSVLQYSDGT